MLSFFQYNPVSHDEGRSSQQQERLDSILKHEHVFMIKYFLSKLKRFLRKRMDYKFYWSSYYVLVSMTCGAIIAGIDGLPFIDGLFVAASAMTGAGLSTVPMYVLSRGSFAIMSILMIIGCAPFMILPPIFFRRKYFAQVKAEILQQRMTGSLPSFESLTPPEQHIIKEYDQIYDALGVLRVVGILYYIGIAVSGVFIIYGALHLHPLPQELIHRNMNHFDYAAFLTVSAFGNAGFTLTTDNLVQLDNNPLAYVWLAFLILAGNTAFPIFLRIFIYLLAKTAPHWTRIFYTIKYQVFVTPAATITALQRSTSKEVLETSTTNTPEAQQPTKESTEHSHAVASSITSPAKRQNQPQQRPSLTLLQSTYLAQLQQQPTFESYRDEMIGLLNFILDNPRQITTHLFSPIQTKVLAIMVLTLIFTQYVFFLCSTLTRPSVTQQYTLSELAGLGYFQTLSTRSAGFNIMNLRSLNQGLLFVYGIMMYLSAFPFVATLQSTTQNRVILVEEHGKDLDLLDLQVKSQQAAIRLNNQSQRSEVRGSASKHHHSSDGVGSRPAAAAGNTSSSRGGGMIEMMKTTYDFTFRNDYRHHMKSATIATNFKDTTTHGTSSNKNRSNGLGDLFLVSSHGSTIRRSSSHGELSNSVNQDGNKATNNVSASRRRSSNGSTSSNDSNGRHRENKATTGNTSGQKSQKPVGLVEKTSGKARVRTSSEPTLTITGNKGIITTTATSAGSQEPLLHNNDSKNESAKNPSSMKEIEGLSSYDFDWYQTQSMKVMNSSHREDEKETEEESFYILEDENTQNPTKEKTNEKEAMTVKSMTDASPVSEKKTRTVSIDELAEIELTKSKMKLLQNAEGHANGDMHMQVSNQDDQSHPLSSAAVEQQQSGEEQDGDAESIDPEDSDDIEDDLDTAVRKYLSKLNRRRRISYNGSRGSVVIIDEHNVNVVEINKKFAKQFLFRHSFFLILAVLVCAFSEDRILSDPSIDVNLWYIMFEIISAYGNVGLSFGMPGEDYSLVGAFTTLGKFVIICIMWLGKHRGLPSSQDDVIDFNFSKYKLACRSESLLALPASPIDKNASSAKASSVQGEDHKTDT
jgi:Trk-type K+ transport system membrane component